MSGLLALVACEKPRQLGARDAGVVVGRVIDAASMLPIGNAVVKRAQGISSVSDPHGAFRITLSPGTGVVRVYAAGYRDVIVPVEIKPGETVIVPPDGYVRLKAAER